MDPLVKEIRQVLQYYASRADYAYAHGKLTCHVLLATEEDGVKLTTTWPRPHFHQPPVQLEKALGVTGIAGHYHMPEGLHASQLQGYAEVLRHAAVTGEISYATMDDKLDQVLGALVARNPELGGLVPGQDKLARYNIVLGVASEFNVKDIQYFIDYFPDLADPPGGRYDEAWRNVQKFHPICWIPAPETMFALERQVCKQGFTPKVAREKKFSFGGF